ncbi:DEKNAAC104870 [Brettanomyces naardenensis]|uniref:Small ribosomal subunit protein mS38 n=1 Tax=Brettanomyces naardenensis TaxID=13370 RepID=A0A448YRW1_BRENA|nr:DEKNAAC104870 [Brettanomyces naardenensis]
MFAKIGRLMGTMGTIASRRFASTMQFTPRTVLPQQALQIKFHIDDAKQLFAGLPKDTFKSKILSEMVEPNNETETPMEMTSVLRKRRLKMKKHKLRKRRKVQRALRIRIGK